MQISWSTRALQTAKSERKARTMSGNMIADARMIANLCGSEFASDKELEALAHEFYTTYGCHWTEILN